MATKAHFVLLLQRRCTQFSYSIHIHMYTYICKYLYILFCRYMQDKSKHHTVGLFCKGAVQKKKLVADLKPQEIAKYHSHSKPLSLRIKIEMGSSF